MSYLVFFCWFVFFLTGEEKNHDSSINLNTAQNMSYQAVAQAVLDAVRLLVSLQWRLCAASSGSSFSPFKHFSKSPCVFIDPSFLCSQGKLKSVSWMSLLWPIPCTWAWRKRWHFALFCLVLLLLASTATKDLGFGLMDLLQAAFCLVV